MKIVDLLSGDLIVAQMRAKSKAAAIDEIVAQMVSAHSGIDHKLAVEVLLERERLGSTGVGQGFAIPHGKLPKLTQAVACFSRSVSGIGFDSLDGNPVHLFFTLLAPEGAAGLHLKALARASRLFKSESFRADLIQAESESQLWSLICEHDEMLNVAVPSND